MLVKIKNLPKTVPENYRHVGIFNVGVGRLLVVIALAAFLVGTSWMPRVDGGINGKLGGREERGMVCYAIGMVWYIGIMVVG